MKTIDPSSLSQQDRHRYLLTAVAPRPICFASTIDAKGNVNLSPFSFFNVFSSSPPIMIFSPARSGKDNSTKDTHDNVMEVKEVVINIVNYKMVEQMSLSSTAYPKGVNEFVKAGFTQVKSEIVKPPRVGEAPVAFECVVNDVIALGTNLGAGNLVICEVKLIHIEEEYLDTEGYLDTNKLDLVARMGGNTYCRAKDEALFEIKKPFGKIGIGFDQLPSEITDSEYLTGNHIAKLAGVEALPTLEKINGYKDDSANQKLLKTSQEEKHQLAKLYIDRDRIEEALLLLLSK